MSESRKEFSFFKEKSQIIHPIVVAGTAATTIAFSLYPIEYIQTRIQLGIKKPSTMSFTTFFLANWKPIFQGFSNTCKGSFAKNGVISQRESIKNKLEIEEKQINESITENNEQEITKIGKQGLISAAFASGIISFFDTSCTQYFANARVKNSIGEMLDLSLLKKIQFSRAGFNVRLSRNFINAFFCIGADTMVKPLVNYFLPDQEYRIANLMISNSIAGALSGIIMNPFDVIYKHTIQETDMKILKAPQTLQLTKELLRKEGYRHFFKGASMSMLMSTVVYAILNGIDFDHISRFLLRMDEEKPVRQRMKH
jgi:hypothetical protein